ncbi:MAG: PH domain-containing protein [Aeoliella sp.]
MQCPQCSADADQQAVFCPRCGHRLADDAVDDNFSGQDSNLDTREKFQQAVASRQGDDVGDEGDVWQGSYSRMAMIGWWITAAITTVIGLIATLVYASTYFWWVLLLIVIGWVILGLRYAYRRYSVHYYLTTQRFIHETGILWRQTDRIELIDIDDVTFRQGPVERMFNVGSIHISSSDKTDPELELPGIEHVKDVAGQIDDLRRRERRRRGLHIEAV